MQTLPLHQADVNLNGQRIKTANAHNYVCETFS